MVVSLVNSVEFYSHLSSSGYLYGARRNGQVRAGTLNENSSLKDINQVNLNRAASEKIGTGTDTSLKTSGIYVDVVHPQYSKQSPVSKPRESFKSVLEVLINRPELNSRIYSRPSTKRADSSNDPYSTKETEIRENGFVITVPEEHMDKLNEGRSDSLQNKLYDIYNSNLHNYSGSLVNVSA